MKHVLRSRRLKRIYVLLFLVTASAFIALISCNYSVETYSRPFTYSDNSLIPYNKAGLVLGTSKYLGNGQVNPYFENRIAASAALYHAGKISYLIVSGDNSVATYNEPQMMRAALEERGVGDRINLDA